MALPRPERKTMLRKVRTFCRRPLAQPAAPRNRFPGVEPVGPRVSRFGFLWGRFPPQLRLCAWPTTDYEAVPGIAPRTTSSASARS